MLKTWVEWCEPFDDSNEPVFCRVEKSTAINHMKALHPNVYGNDESALFDFMAVHWAHLAERPV